MRKIFVVGTACTGLREVYQYLLQITGQSGCDETHNKATMDCVVRHKITASQLIDRHRTEQATIDKAHANLWLTEQLASEFPDAIFVTMKRPVKTVVADMLQNSGITNWCTNFKQQGVQFPSVFLGATDESAYRKLSLQQRCEARVVSHYQEIDRLAQVIPAHRFIVLEYADTWQPVLRQALKVPESDLPVIERPAVERSGGAAVPWCFYWINLERATNRRQRMEAQFAQRNLKNQRVIAFDGKTSASLNCFIDASKWPQHLIKTHKFEIATTLSHLRALHAFVRSGVDNVGIICEDDLSFEYETSWRHSLNDQINHAPADWNLLQLGIIISDTKGWHRVMALNKSYHPRQSHWWSAIAYAIKRKAAVKLLCQYSVPIDSDEFRCTLTGDVQRIQSERIILGTGDGRYLVYPPPFTYPDRNESFIHPSHLGLHQSSKRLVTKSYDKN